MTLVPGGAAIRPLERSDVINSGRTSACNPGAGHAVRPRDRVAIRPAGESAGAGAGAGEGCPAYLQNAMTLSEERTSAESRGLPHREITDGLRRPPLKRGATQSISVLEQILGCYGIGC